MTKCNSCGGIQGVDCWNAMGCAQIIARLSQYDTYESMIRIDQLVRFIKDHGLEVPPDLNYVQDDQQGDFNEDDDNLPF